MKKKCSILLALLLALPFTLQAQDVIKLVVGTRTDGSSKGVYSFEFNQLTGESKALDTLEMTNPTYVTISSDGKVIYAVNETTDDNASVSAIDFDSTTGQMKFKGSQPTNGTGPCYVETNDNFLLTANYNGGSMSLFPLTIDGTIKPMTQQFKGSTGGTYMPNQEQPHIHMATCTPDGGYVLATDFSADRILKFDISGMQDITSSGVAGTVAPGSGPRHIAFSNDSRFFYVISELAGTVTVFSWYNGKAKQVQVVKSDSVGGHGSADIHFSTDGNYLYTSNRLKSDGISIYKVNKKTGMLRKIAYQPTAKRPRNFCLTPNGKFLLCACKDGGKIQVFRVNTLTGLLDDTGKDIIVDRPSCVKFYPKVMQPGIGDGQFRVIEK